MPLFLLNHIAFLLHKIVKKTTAEKLISLFPLVWPTGSLQSKLIKLMR